MAAAPNNLLKFVDFDGEKAVTAKVVGKKTGTHIYSIKPAGSIKNAISFDVIQFKSFKIFLERFPSVVICSFLK